MQVLADLDLSINKAYISSDGRWFMDVFHVTDRLGRKLTDDSVITYIKQVGFRFLGPRRRKQRLCRVLFLTVRVAARSRSRCMGTWNGPARPAALEGLTALELTGADRTGLLSEVFAVLADMECSVVEARAWTHRGRLACVAFLRGEDADAGRVPRILAHADRRLH